MDKAKFFKNNKSKLNNIFGKAKPTPKDEWILIDGVGEYNLNNSIRNLTDAEGEYDLFFNHHRNQFKAVGTEGNTEGLSIVYQLEVPLAELTQEQKDYILWCRFGDNWKNAGGFSTEDVFVIGKNITIHSIEDTRPKFKPTILQFGFAVSLIETIEVKVESQEQYDEILHALENQNIVSVEDVEDFATDNGIEVESKQYHTEDKETLEISQNFGGSTINLYRGFYGEPVWNNNK